MLNNAKVKFNLVHRENGRLEFDPTFEPNQSAMADKIKMPEP